MEVASASMAGRTSLRVTGPVRGQGGCQGDRSSTKTVVATVTSLFITPEMTVSPLVKSTLFYHIEEVKAA